MNEITKLYENANVEKHLAYFECHRGRSSKRCCPINPEEKDKECAVCVYSDEMKEVYEYPPFTAEKQLELIKWLSQHTYRNYIKFRFDICGLWYCECNMLNSDMHHTFEDALAQIVNNLWQDLTSEEKQQIKEILE